MPNILVRDAAGSLLTMKTVELAGVHTPYQVVGSIEKKFRDSFPGPSLDSAKWDNSIGAGGSITFSGGAIVIASGTTINSDTSITTKETFQIPFRVSFNAVLSQRIINQSFIVEAISVNSTTGVPDGQHTCAWVFDGTTATQAKYRVQNSALTPLDSAASTVPTTASAGLYELEPFADECWFHGGTLDATTGRANSYRRHQQIPDPNGTYKIRVRWLNGATAPATTTTASLQFVAIQDYQELTAEITAGRGQSVAGQAIAAAVVSMPTVYANSMDNQFWNDSVVAQAISATVTGTARDIGVAAGGVHRYSKFNASAVADQAGTLRIECSNDNITWRRATADTAVAAIACVYLSVPIMTRYYRAVYVNGGVAQTAFMLNTSFTAA
jgi:hypothetical protein